MTGDPERFVWKPDEAVIHQPDILDTVAATRKCEGCSTRLTGDEAIPGLCAACADTIDRDTEELLEREHFGEDLP